MTDADGSNSETPEPETAGSAPAGWYEDPHDSTQQRYWDGTTWTEDRKSNASLPTGVRVSDDVRRQKLRQQIAHVLASGGTRVELQNDFDAILVKKVEVNHVLHAVLTMVTCGLWSIVWLVIFLNSNKEHRIMLTVDEFGAGTQQQLT